MHRTRERQPVRTLGADAARSEPGLGGDPETQAEALRRESSLLVVAGEGSGDVMASRALAHLSVPSFGWGGPELRARGTDTLCDVSELSLLGFATVVVRLPRLLHEARRLLAAVDARRPNAALLAGYSEFNGWLGPRLRQRGVRVLWYGAPQIWAWRPGRGRRYSAACDQLALMFPFEEELWRSFGAETSYVGHPALEVDWMDRSRARAVLGLGPDPAIALLPGSRTAEVHAHLPVLLGATARLRARYPDLGARVLVASALGGADRRWLEARAREARVIPVATDPVATLPAYDLALVASGTATLECALAGVPPIIVYRLPSLSAAVLRRLIQVPHVGLPNLVLQRDCFPELLQDRLDEAALAAAAQEVLAERETYLRACHEVRSRLSGDATKAPSSRVAQILDTWLK
jgi:lipid-A-disaccharide synthase